MKHEGLAISIKLIHHHALKDISEALEQKLSSSKDISEAHSVLANSNQIGFSQKVCTARMIVVN